MQLWLSPAAVRLFQRLSRAKAKVEVIPPGPNAQAGTYVHPGPGRAGKLSRGRGYHPAWESSGTGTRGGFRHQHQQYHRGGSGGRGGGRGHNRDGRPYYQQSRYTSYPSGQGSENSLSSRQLRQIIGSTPSVQLGRSITSITSGSERSNSSSNVTARAQESSSVYPIKL
eukprot:764908-Hanusia_phi.AAC.3